MLQSKVSTLEIIIVISFIFINCVLGYGISVKSFNIESIEYNIGVELNNIFSSIVPLMVFIFYLLTTRFMFEIINAKFHFYKVLKTILLSYIPIFIMYLLALYIILYLERLGHTSSSEYLNDYFHGYRIETIFNNLKYIWFLFYLIFTILLKNNFKLNLSKSISVSIIPTLVILAFNYLW